MAAATLDLLIEQGATFNYVLTLKDSQSTAINLTGYTARMQIRRSVQSQTEIISLTTANGRIAITPTTGVITLTISATDTSALTFQSAVYDLEIESTNGIVTRIIQGKVTLSPEVTR